MRVGRLNGPYLTGSILSAFPMYSGGGYAEFGIGGKFANGPALWCGANLVGMTATSFQTRLQWGLSERLYLDTGASVGTHEGESVYGGSIGVTYRVVH